MSILSTAKEGWIVSHSQYLDEIYRSVKSGDTAACPLRFKKMLFEINSQYLRQNQVTHSVQDEGLELRGKGRKRKRSKAVPEEDSTEMNYVRQTLGNIVSLAKGQGLFSRDVLSDNNEAARLESQRFYRDTFHNEEENFFGCNDTDRAIVSDVQNKKYVFPKRCSFYCYDVRDISKKMEPNNQYDFVLLDPPWWNKSIRRKKSKYVEAR